MRVGAGRARIPAGRRAHSVLRSPGPRRVYHHHGVREPDELLQPLDARHVHLPALLRAGKGDDSFFREFLFCRHPGISAYNFTPNLVEHIDWLIGGSTLTTGGSWHHDLPRSALWEEESETLDLQARIRAWKKQHEQITP